jgi:hypothetical protein
MVCVAMLACSQPKPVPEAAESVAAGPASEAQVAAPAPVRRFELDGSEVRTLSSPETGRDYLIVVRPPASFKTEPEKRYPVLYLLDAQWNFELLNRIVSSLVFDQAIPEVLVVGITYTGDSPDYDTLRRHDLIPTQAVAYDGKVSGGGAKQFLEFLEKRVIPMAETEYRAAPGTRILSGASYGGLFVLYALFEKPGLFNGYFSMSPAVVWDDRWIFAREQASRELGKSFEADVWMSVGSAEWPNYVAANQEFFQQMEQARRPGTRIMTRTIEGEGHAGNLPEAHTRSLRFFFEHWRAAQSAASVGN